MTVGSSTPGGGYGSASGTSVSAPHASGTAALMLEANPSLSPAGVMGLMQATATPVEPSRDPAGGAGQVDALAAVAAALGIDPPRVPFGRLSPAGVPAPECLRRERAAVGPSPRPGRVRLTATQLRINQRISQAAVRRSNRLAGCLGVADRVRTGGTGTRRTGVRLTAAQVRINQRIAQAAVRRLNALRAEVTS